MCELAQARKLNKFGIASLEGTTQTKIQIYIQAPVWATVNDEDNGHNHKMVI